jgi:outer membrane protein
LKRFSTITLAFFLKKNQFGFNTMIKKVIFAAAIAATATTTINAQKIAIVDITQVLQAQPDYKKAQEELDKIAQQWRQEIAQQQDIVKGMYERLRAEQPLLTKEAFSKREDEIEAKSKTIRDMQREKFGPEGALFKKRQELVKPVQDRVYGAIEKFAADRGFDLILDKGGSAGIIFASPSFDKTQMIIDMLKK